MNEHLRSYQSCRSTEGWVPVQVASSTKGIDYVIHVCPWGISSESICECAGYTYRGHCRHQQIAHESLCRWNELEGPEEQDEEQAKNKECPRCGQQTRWEMEIVSED